MPLSGGLAGIQDKLRHHPELYHPENRPSPPRLVFSEAKLTERQNCGHACLLYALEYPSGYFPSGGGLNMANRNRRISRLIALASLFLFRDIGTLIAADLESPPISYATAKENNSISGLQEAIQSGKSKLAFEKKWGYLPGVLKALDVPISSQMLVFSKTSLQRNKISPTTPRALYFNDEVYIGFCQSGDVLEVSVADPQLGTAFYILEQIKQKTPRFQRQTDSCLICHGSSVTQGFPGHLARSVYPDREGQPLFSLGSHRVEHSTPLAKRWGGWFVSGTTPGRHHLGNMTLPQNTRNPPEENPKGSNLTDLSKLCETTEYLAPHSDLVALLVFEHQAEAHNRITRAALETRIALHQQEEFDRILKRTTEGFSESTARRIDSACESLVEYLFFCGEAPLGGKVTGTSPFASEFSARGAKDSHGRSLRDFDLNERMFKYPLSYLVLTKSFEGLPKEAKDAATKKIVEILKKGSPEEKYAHLTPERRAAIREILTQTSPNWKAKLEQ